MKIVFYDNLFDNLGIQYLSSSIDTSGHKSVTIFNPSSIDPFNPGKLVDRYLERDHICSIAKKILNKNPDIVGFSTFTHNFQYYLKIAKQIKEFESNVMTVFGGIHATLTEGRMLKHDSIDFVVRGEAEAVLVKLLNALEDNTGFENIDNLCFSKNNSYHFNPISPLDKDLDRLPFPNKIDYIKQSSILSYRYSIIAGRGCCYDCNFCSTQRLHEIYGPRQPRVRMRSCENIISELIEARQKYNFKIVFFMDELFAYSKSWIKNFSKLYRSEINLPIDCITHPSFINNETARQLRLMNVKSVAIGMQTANPEIKKKILNRQESNDRISRATQLLKQNKINVALDHIFYLPGEIDNELILNSIREYSRISPSYITMNWLAYYPGTKIVKIAKEMGILTEDNVKEIGEGSYFHGVNSLDIREKKKILKYKFLISCIGFLPGSLIRYLSHHLAFIPASNSMANFIQFFSRVFIHRRFWIIFYMKSSIISYFNRKWSK